MASVTSFFNVGGNPFSTPVGQRIEQATDGSLASENWALNMEICDLINESSESARDAMKAIRKRLNQNAGKNHTVIMYTLTVLETCVKNCGKAFHLLVANKEFIQELVKLIGPKNDPPAVVQERVLSLIQIWADAFKKQPDLNGVVQIYQDLKNKGIEFPMTDMDALAPIYTPQRSVPETKQNIQPVPKSPQNSGVVMPDNVDSSSTMPMNLSTEQIGKLQSEFDIVSLNMSIFAEMLTELKPGLEDPKDYALLTELAATCKEMQTRIVELIGKINHDEFTAEMLRLNDELNNLFLRHARYENNRDPSSVSAPSAMLGVAMGISNTETTKPEQNSLIDLSEEATGNTEDLTKKMGSLGLASTQLANITAQSAQTGSRIPSKDHDIDEFDMLAQSRKSTTGVGKSDKTSESSPNGSTTQIKNQENSETEFDEIAAWLQTSNEEENVPEESVTSKEFEKFLAERAAAAESLPTIPSQTGSTAKTTGSNSNSSTDTPQKQKERKEAEPFLAL